MRIFLYEDRICFLDSTSQLLIFPAIRGYTWHKTEKQRYNDDATVITKSRHNKSKIKFYSFGLPPKSAFFYAFKLGIMHRGINNHHNNRSYKLLQMVPQQVHFLPSRKGVHTFCLPA